MKPRSINPLYVLVTVIVAAAAFTLVSWDNKHDSTRYHQFRADNDTTPNRNKNVRDKKVRNLDEAIEELDNVNIDAELENAMKEVAKSMKEFDGEKMKLEVQNSLKNVDFEKIKAEVDKAMKEVDFEKINKEISESLKEIDSEKMKKDISESLAKIDWDGMKKEINEMKIDMSGMDKEMKKVSEELKNMGPKLKKDLEGAKIEIEKAKVELKEYKVFVDGLDNDGLIKKNEPYTIKHKDGQLTISGKPASTQTYAKYRSFLDKHKSFSIVKTEDDFDINTGSHLRVD